MPQGNVLIVDDDDSVRHLLMEYVKDSGRRVDGARDGADALHFIHLHHYDLILLDVMMPHMTGVDFLDSLQVLLADRTVKTLRKPPAIIVITSATAEQIPNGRIEERSPGMIRAVLRKPLEMGQLRKAMELVSR
jgi:CheY-like chemotaxis protein